MSCLLRHGLRSPADLPGTGGGKYIADFVAPAAKLIVEVDDRSHELRRTADARRDRDLSRLGYRVLRLPAELVRGDVVKAVGLIAAAVIVAT